MSLISVYYKRRTCRSKTRHLAVASGGRRSPSTPSRHQRQSTANDSGGPLVKRNGIQYVAHSGPLGISDVVAGRVRNGESLA